MEKEGRKSEYPQHPRPTTESATKVTKEEVAYKIDKAVQ
jgi:hypothetical protein